jgi:hypothetical protein
VILASELLLDSINFDGSCVDQFGSELSVPHCNDADCAGGDESSISPDLSAMT